MNKDVNFYDIPLDELGKDPVLRNRLKNLVDELKKEFKKDGTKIKLPGED